MVQSAPTRASLGILTRPTQATDGLSAFYRLSHKLHESLAPQLVAETGVDVGHRACGGLEIAYTDHEAEQLRLHVNRLQLRGAECHWLSPDDAREREPALSDDLVAACLWPKDHRVDPLMLAMGLWQGARALGAIYHSGRVERLECGPPLAVVLATGERLEAEAIVIAAGAGSSPLLAAAGISPRSIRPAPGQSLRLQMVPDLAGIVHWDGFHLLPLGPGSVFVGSTNDELSNEAVATCEGKRQLHHVARRVLDTEGNVLTHAAGLRPKPRRGRALIAPLAWPGCYVASGHYKNGVLLAPATGRALAKWIMNGDPGIDMSPFALAR